MEFIDFSIILMSAFVAIMFGLLAGDVKLGVGAACKTLGTKKAIL